MAICVLCEKEKQQRDFKSRNENEPAIKTSICKICYNWLVVKIKNHSSRTSTDLEMNAWLEILERSRGVCEYCHEQVGIRRLTIEHIIPIAKGGTNNADNIAAACSPCNNSKQKRTVE